MMTGMGKKTIEEMFDELLTSGVIDSPGRLSFSLAKIDINVNSKDVVGGVLQEWLGHWMQSRHYDVTSPANSQAFPDFYLNEFDMLECKSFAYGKKPGFDVAAYSSYIESLNSIPSRLDASYIVFGYTLENGIVFIKNIWLKKVWQLTGPSVTNLLELQVKRQYPQNIRPKNFPINPQACFASRLEFCEKLHMSAIRFKPIRGHSEGWLENLKINYREYSGQDL
jgi:type II restriction enzyme